MKEKVSELNLNSNGILAFVSGSASFKVGDKVKTKGEGNEVI